MLTLTKLHVRTVYHHTNTNSHIYRNHCHTNESASTRRLLVRFVRTRAKPPSHRSVVTSVRSINCSFIFHGLPPTNEDEKFGSLFIGIPKIRSVFLKDVFQNLFKSEMAFFASTNAENLSHAMPHSHTSIRNNFLLSLLSPFK